MATKLIRLQDGTLIEVEVPEGEVQQIVSSKAKAVHAAFDEIKPVLLQTCKPIAAALKEVRDEVGLEQVEMELGVSFEVEGNVYITKATLGANVIVRMTLKNKE